MLVSEQMTALKRYGFSDSDPLLTWLIAAMHDLERSYNWPWLFETADVNVAAGANALVLPSDAFRVQSIKDITHTGIKLRGYDRTRFDREIMDQTSSGKAMVYCLTGLTTIQLWPVPDEATTYQVTYHKKLTEPSSGADTMDVPEDLHYPIVHGAAYYALQAESEEDRSSVAEKQFRDAIIQTIARYAPPDEDEPRQVVDSQGYGDEYAHVYR